MRCLAPILGPAVALALSMALPALAQPAADPPKPPPPAAIPAGPEVTRPKPEAVEVFYPPGATGDAVVVLEMVVDETGRITDVKAVVGEPPFSTAAITASKNFRFAPATRDGKPVAAKIRYELKFTEPPPPEPEPEPAPPLASTPPTGAEPPKPPPQPPPPGPIEVTIEGERKPPSVTTFTRAEVRELPGAFGDPFRAIEAMPGVTPIISGLPYFFVRGAPPGNIGYFLDGIRVPLLYHVALGPSVVHPGIVERVDLYSGGYPARYGRFAGGIVAGETTPPRPEFHGEANVRLLDAGALVEAPVFDGRGTVLVGGRYSYTALLLTLASPDAILQYWDYQVRASYDVTPKDQLSVFSFGAFDFIGEKQESGTQVLFSTEFHRVDLRWDHRASERTQVRLATTLGLELTRGDEDDFFLRDRSLSVRTEIAHKADENVRLKLGADVSTDTFDINAPDNNDSEDPAQAAEDRKQFDEAFPIRTDLATGVWGEVAFKPEPWLTITPGLRVDLYVSDGASAVGVDPRISARYELNDKWRLLHALGIAHQPPSFVIPIPGFQISDLRSGLQRALQHSAGVEADLPQEFSAGVTLFHNAFFRMTDVLGTLKDDGNDETDDEPKFDDRSLGHSYGVEVFVRRSLAKKLGGFLSYTLSRSTRSIGREHFPSSFDRTHVLNLALAYDLGRRWRAGSRLVFYTGFPNQGDRNPIGRSSRPDRIPAFYRIDARLEKRWRLGKKGYWAFVIEWLNATLQKETVSVDCSTGQCVPEEIGPVTIPSIGLEAFF